MAMLAMSLGSVSTAADVLGTCGRLKVGRIYTRVALAQVINRHSLGNRTDEIFIGEAMRHDGPPLRAEMAIALDMQ
jgi:hypothetical protein